MSLQNDLSNKVDLFNSYKIDFRGVNLLSLSQVYVFELGLKRLKKDSLINFLKFMSLDSYLKALISISFKAKSPNELKSEYLFINDVYNSSMIDNLRRVQNNFNQNHIEIICDKRIKTSKNYYFFSFFSFYRYLSSLLKGSAICIKNFKTIKTIASEFKINKYLLFLNLIESIFILNCAENLVRKLPNLKKIILNTDVHKVSRAICLVSPAKNIKTYVIQHGMTVLEYGYLPVMADKMFTWGELSNNWFIERNTKPQKLVTTGTPKMDSISEYIIVKNQTKQIKNVLIVVNPIGDNNLNQFFSILYNSKIHHNYNINIKLHPGSVDNKNMIFNYYTPEEVRIFKHENTHDLISNNDIVVTTTSTVGLEAVAFYKPLIKINIKEIDIVLDYEKYNCSHNISNHQELKELMTDNSTIYSKIENYDLCIHNCFYKLDGKSSKRIIDNVLI